MHIYTDGSCLGNGKDDAIGGWAFCVVDTDNDKTILKAAGYEKNTTNNRMELTALIRALQFAIGEELNIDMCYTDSAYICNCINQKWYEKWKNNGWINSKKEPVKNQDLWEQLLKLLETHNIPISKVKGHADNQYNNEVDRMATSAAAILGKQ